MTRAAALVLIICSACAPLTGQQISDLDHWNTAAANHCASAGACPAAAKCVDAAAAALGLAGSYVAAASACGAFR